MRPRERCCYTRERLEPTIASADPAPSAGSGLRRRLLPLSGIVLLLVAWDLAIRFGNVPLLPGPVLINAGRGGLQVDADVLAALQAGELYAASLDVFETEPLAAESPLWRHPRVVVTPHNAAESAPSAIARYALSQLRAHKSGAALENLVDRARGY